MYDVLPTEKQVGKFASLPGEPSLSLHQHSRVISIPQTYLLTNIWTNFVGLLKALCIEILHGIFIMAAKITF